MAGIVILIVDDDRTIVRLCQRLLERSQFEVITALDPLEALQVIERQKIDLLLSDVRMPVMDGFELVETARQYQPDLPVIVMTGYGSIETAIQALHRGVNGLILKPFSTALELTHAVQRVLAESRQKRDAARLHVLRPLFDVTEQLLSENSPEVLETLILEAMLRLSQASFAGIYRVTARQRAEPAVFLVNESHPLLPGPDLDQLLLSVEGSGAAVLNASGPGDVDVQQRLRNLGWGAALITRVQQSAGPLVFCASRGLEAGNFSEADLEMFVILARQAAVAMENARLYDHLMEYVRQLEESQRALVQAEKMAAVGRLMASMAHEINNPLQAVRNSLHLAARRDLPSEKRAQFIDMTSGQLERLVKTVREMLDFYRPGGDEWEPVDLRLVIDQILLLLDAQMREQGVKLHVNCQTDLVIVMGLADQLQQVMLNLLINALDSLEEAGIRQQAINKEIWIDIERIAGGQLRILVEDSGAGVPFELQERIFEPFISTKKNGTGLGLAVSYGIMERHQGSLKIVSPRYRHGACFEVILPTHIEG